MANQPIIKTDSTIHEKQEQKAKKNSMSEKLMPALFLGHGSPMNAIEENDFVKTFRSIGQSLPKPKAILCVSAHWETKGTLVTAMPTPRTIHDFGGFPKELYEINYPAPGSPECAEKVKQEVQKTEIGLDYQWGLDHGAWTVIKHLYPMADVPVFQMSIDYSKPAQYHYELATELQQFRKRGVLIIGSGNMVHNLGMVAWNKLQEPEYGYDWALEANEKMKSFIKTSNHASLINFKAQGKAFELSIPTPEHYLPLLYVLGLKNDKDDVKIFNDKAIGGSLTMTSVGVGELSV
ncbi:MAG: 4,5-DOPA dioxygenase extradiol [Flavobacteriales bacterium]|nr:4,5-DOPA dioxygenase extradiol [Flavobacteriales bacterium]